MEQTILMVNEFLVQGIMAGCAASLLMAATIVGTFWSEHRAGKGE